MSLLAACRLLPFRTHESDLGGLIFAEEPRDLPFLVRRFYALLNVPPGGTRGGHGHLRLEQVFVALSGSFTVTVTDGVESRRWTLNRPDQGLYLGPLLWREVHDFSAGAVCLVLASRVYEESDYFRSWDGYLHARGLPA